MSDNRIRIAAKLKVNIWQSIFNNFLFKVHIFWEGHKILRNLHRRFDRYYIGQIYGGDFAKICGLLRIYELYLKFLSYLYLKCIWDPYQNTFVFPFDFCYFSTKKNCSQYRINCVTSLFCPPNHHSVSEERTIFSIMSTTKTELFFTICTLLVHAVQCAWFYKKFILLGVLKGD